MISDSKTKNTMPINDYSIRSKEVQEVLSNPPKKYITWGTVIIILLFCSFLCLLNFYDVPNNSQLPFKVTESRLNSTKDSILLKLFLNTAAPENLINSKNVNLIFNENLSFHYGKVDAIIKDVNLDSNFATVSIASKKNGGIKTQSNQTIFISTAIFGIIEFKSGSTSMLKLFVKRQIRR